MKSGVLYYHAGRGFATRLAVSLHSLRQHYRGPVAIMTDATAKALSERIGSALGATVIEIEPPKMRRHGHYLAKTQLWRHTPFERSLFLDADTVVAGPIDELLQIDGRVVITHFADWYSTGRKMSARIRGFSGVTPMIDQLVQASTTIKFPAINTGVVRFDRDFDGLEQWEAITAAVSPRFIADEIAMQVVFPLWGRNCVVVDDRWNCSPIFGTHKAEAKISHFHGDKHLRKGGQEIWGPAYRAACEADVAGLREWAAAEDRWVRELSPTGDLQGCL